MKVKKSTQKVKEEKEEIQPKEQKNTKPKWFKYPSNWSNEGAFCILKRNKGYMRAPVTFGMLYR